MNPMETELIDSICAHVYNTYPEVKGCRPKIRAYAQTRQLLIFQSRATAGDGRTISHTIRVVVGPDGKIIKMSSSK